MPKEPERRRNRRETAGHARRAARRRISPGASPAPREPMLTETPKEPESRRNPGEFADHEAEDELV
jgi:hypothetical protein